MKRYLLFSGDEYYPLGGALDLKYCSDNLIDVINSEIIGSFDYDGGWANVYDYKENKIIFYFERGVFYLEQGLEYIDHGEKLTKKEILKHFKL